MVLKVRGLSVTYGQKKAVDHISFEVRAGQVLGLLGANGAGKSSTIAAVLGIQKSTYDELIIAGKSPINQRKEIFEEVGVQFQETNFQDKLTVAEACEQWRSLYRTTADTDALLHTFGLEDKQQQLVKSLSGGERQRLAVLLALIPDPKLVFLDELTTGLDTKARRMLWKQLVSMKENGLAIVLTSHYMDEVEALCDEILILRESRTVFHGNLQEALAVSGKATLEDAYLHFAGEEEY
ncbi:ABC transporter ATP-binding protein [Paenibacillus sp. MMS20-IR301]|uniref:ABC transporter ATP-binding protein n=1 Tax=Paenibacillus sp. MMS20-IR301 TaxID=2895946 RepID=UPI0028E9476A|nr:ABC transporter ATP-binding protein [Paenibacillus sp. MMS20-IR301]WNS42027.1 ABC transporter ATP-binding protein [Paenibacillus sp. MMS20-IR301]